MGRKTPGQTPVNNVLQDRDFLLQRMENFLRRCRVEDSAEKCDRPRASLTISRQCGVGLSRFGRRLLEYLDSVDSLSGSGWALIDQSFIGRIIEEGRFPGTPVQFIPDRSKFPVSPALEETLSHPPDQWTLFNHSANTIRTLCSHGSSIIIGRAGNFVTADLPNTFHVRLIGGKARRISATADRYQIGESEATELVEESDKARARFVKRHTDSDIDDASSYHLVINTDNLSDELVVRIIVDSLHEWETLGNGAENPHLLRVASVGNMKR